MRISIDKVRNHVGFVSAMKILDEQLKNTEDMPMESIFGFFFSMGIESAFRELEKKFMKEKQE